jgi:hypothetical protein
MQNTPLALKAIYCRYKSTVANLATLHKVYLCNSLYQGSKTFPKSRSHFKILDVRSVKECKFCTNDRQILEATIPNLLTWVTLFQAFVIHVLNKHITYSVKCKLHVTTRPVISSCASCFVDWTVSLKTAKVKFGLRVKQGLYYN